MSTKPKATGGVAAKSRKKTDKKECTDKVQAKKAPRKKLLPILRNDPWLEPYAEAVEGRHADALRKEKELTKEAGSLADFANAHNYFGLHRCANGSWVFREWAPNATSLVLTGDFSGWQQP